VEHVKGTCWNTPRNFLFPQVGMEQHPCSYRHVFQGFGWSSAQSDGLMFLVVPVTLWGMTRTRREVGEIVSQRRNELQRDAADLARSAEVDPKTLQSLERGERWPRDRSRSRIEEALGWQLGSLNELRAGREAVVMPPEQARTHYPGKSEHLLRMAIIDAARAVAAITNIALERRDMRALTTSTRVAVELAELLQDEPEETVSRDESEPGAAAAAEVAAVLESLGDDAGIEDTVNGHQQGR
jgi:DNA-binding XRE family transcriptional regulator